MMHGQKNIKLNKPVSSVGSFFSHVRISLRQNVLRRVRKIRHVALSVRPSPWNNSVPTGRIFIKRYIWVILENQSKKIKFH